MTRLNQVLNTLGSGVKISNICTGQDQIIIGRAAVAAARLAEDEKAPTKYWVLEQPDIIKLGRNEWKE